MARKSRRSDPDDPFGSADLQLLDLIRGQDAIIRAALCTLARNGVAFRQAEPARAANWLDVLSTHPFYKAGQVLFDLLEWEDFMLDGPPPPVLGTAQAVLILRRVADGLLTTQGSTPSVASIVEPSSAPELPPLEPGFYLYRDVVLGALGYVLRSFAT